MSSATTAASRRARFDCLYSHGLLRVAACSPKVEIADPAANAAATLALAQAGHADGVGLMVFPELGLSAYAIDDLLGQDALLAAVEQALLSLAKEAAELTPVLVVGLPLRRNGRLYNCAAVLHGGRVLGVTPKTYLPNYREYYEKRWFASGRDTAGLSVRLGGEDVPFGPDLIFVADGLDGFVVHVEICEDFWAPTPPSGLGALAGATVLCNLSASNVTVGKAAVRHTLAQSQSERCAAAYVYAAAGAGESTTDVAWDGQTSIYELGHLLAASERFPLSTSVTTADVDLQRITLERLRTGTFNDAAAAYGAPETRFRRVSFPFTPPAGDLGLKRSVERFPFAPADPAHLDQDCYEAYNIQVQGLEQRLRATGTQKLCIGVSGGLDSTQALIVAAKAFDRLSLPRENILAFTLPGFATGDTTKSRAWALMRAIGATAEEVDIRPMATQLLTDLGHPFADGEPVYDVTFENVQAGLRTDFLFRAANQRGAIVLGTGDLSELALGWCTYGVGDQMSHYNVNAGVAKTLIQHLIRWSATRGGFDEETGRLLIDIVEQEISPELVPAGADGAIQSTEAKIGPYDLQDFTLHYLARYGLPPSKIAFLAHHAWSDATAGDWPPGYPEARRRSYDLPEIKRWMEVFLTRFFTQQFKRSAMPNGPKVTSGGALSPRGDWRAPSDSNPRVWLQELRDNVP